MGYRLFPQALLTLFVFSTKDGWVTIMYDGIDAVDPEIQVNVISQETCALMKTKLSFTQRSASDYELCMKMITREIGGVFSRCRILKGMDCSQITLN